MNAENQSGVLMLTKSMMAAPFSASGGAFVNDLAFSIRNYFVSPIRLSGTGEETTN